MSFASDVSVVIPVYNPGPHLNNCIESVLTQHGCDIEVLIVDDGSTDNSPGVLDELSGRDPRVTVFHQANQGAGPARNFGIEHAHGAYIAFMDADDFYPNNHVLSDLLNAAEANKASVCGGSIALFKQDTETYVDTFAEDELYVFKKRGWRDYVNDQMDYGYTRFIYKRDIFEDVSLRFPARKWYEDPLFYVPVMQKIQRYYVLTDVVYVYRISHKQTDWTPRLACDLLLGSMENYRFAHEHGLAKLKRTIMHRLTTVDCPHVILNTTDDEVLRRLGDFQAMLNDLGTNEVVPILRELGKRSEYLDVVVQDLADERSDRMLLERKLAQISDNRDTSINQREVAIVRLARIIGGSRIYRGMQRIARALLHPQG